MIQKYLVADLSDTALVIECGKCNFALVLAQPGKPVLDVHRDAKGGAMCLCCGETLIAHDVPRRPIVERYNAFLKAAMGEEEGQARIRIRVPTGPPMPA